MMMMMMMMMMMTMMMTTTTTTIIMVLRCPDVYQAQADRATGGRADMPSFDYVFIPAAASAAMEQRSMEYSQATEVSCLIDSLKLHFKAVVSDNPEARNAVKEAFKKRIGAVEARSSSHFAVMVVLFLLCVTRLLLPAFPSPLSRPAGQDIPDSSLNDFLDMQMVDTVALLSGGRHSNFVHINMYVDDQGVAKGLPQNERATSLTGQSIGVE